MSDLAAAANALDQVLHGNLGRQTFAEAAGVFLSRHGEAILAALRPVPDEAAVEKLRGAIELLEAGLQHPPTMFYTRPFSLAEATRTVIAAALLSIEQVRGDEGWLSIESAPKDQFILLHEDGAIRCGFWNGERWEPAEIPILVDEVGNRIVGREWSMLHRGQSLELSGFLYEPTHWRPLPPPPAIPTGDSDR